MYPNYTSINPNTVPSYQQNRVPATPYMGSNTSMQNVGTDDRFIAGGFLAPFLLGGITGGLLAPAFYNNGGGGYGRPVYNTYYYPNQPYYYYGPYYR
ncbi:MAG: hypothetical protein PHN72_01145 [Bacilli bacterium]|nr:hypothetical protein [Bacilli bacterium]